MRLLNRLLTWLSGASRDSAAELWVTADGREIPIGDMSRSHLVHSLAMIMRRANDNYVWAASKSRPGGISFYTRGAVALEYLRRFE